MADLKRPGIVATYKLEDPIDYAGEKVYMLEFRGMRAGDHLKVEQSCRDGGNVEKSLMYIQLLAEREPYVVQNLSHRDYQAIERLIADFLQPSKQEASTTT